MDNKNPSPNKLVGLRTFATDQEKNTGVKINETPISVAPVVQVATPPKLTSIDREIRKINKGEKEPEPIPAPKIIEPEIPTPPPAPVKPIPTPTPEPAEVKKPESKESVISEKPKVPPIAAETLDKKIENKNNTSGQAAVITDTKKPRFKLFSAIKTAIKRWFTTKPPVPKTKETSVPITPEANTQTVTFQKATRENEKSAIEGDTTSDKIKQQQEEAKEKGQTSKTIWTPNTEPGFLLLDDINEHITNVQIVPRASFYTNQREIVVDDREDLYDRDSDTRWNTESYVPEPIPAPKIIEPEIPTPPPAPVKPIPTPTPEPITETPAVIEPAPVKPVIVETPSLPPVDREAPIAMEEKINTTVPEPGIGNHKNRKNLLLQTSTNTLSFIIAVIVLAVLIITGAGSNLFTSDNSEKNPTAKNYPKALDTDLQNRKLFHLLRCHFLILLHQLLQSCHQQKQFFQCW